MNTKVVSFAAAQTKQKELRRLTRSIDMLADLFNLDADQAKENAKQLVSVTGPYRLVAVPDFVSIARLSYRNDLKAAYADATAKILKLLMQQSAMDYDLSCYVSPCTIEIEERTLLALVQILEIQQSGIVIIGAQLGERYMGNLADAASIESLFQNNEFALGAYMVGSILLSEPSWFSSSWFGTSCLGERVNFQPYDQDTIPDQSICFQRDQQENLFWCDSCLRNQAVHTQGVATGFMVAA